MPATNVAGIFLYQKLLVQDLNLEPNEIISRRAFWQVKLLKL